MAAICHYLYMRRPSVMDHSEASRLMASEKYLLDELPPSEMEAFEEHLFGCHECAMDVRAGSVFLEHRSEERRLRSIFLDVTSVPWMCAQALYSWNMARSSWLIPLPRQDASPQKFGRPQAFYGGVRLLPCPPWLFSCL